ncbi:hypothetical protein BGZ98_009027, partial [Dissophora globulifera]
HITTAMTPYPHSSNNSIHGSYHSEHGASSSNVSSKLTGGGHRLNSVSTASVSSISTVSTATSSYSYPNQRSAAKQPIASLKSAVHCRATSPSQPGCTTSAATTAQGRQKRHSSLQPGSELDHSHGANGYSSSKTNLWLDGNGTASSINAGHQYRGGHREMTYIPPSRALALAVPLRQLKLRKMARLLQLLIACTPVQARLPALRYPGYGQQWVRPPCRVDYLEYYIDQQQAGEIIIQCFHLLFADLVQCRWEDEAQGLGEPIAPPDKEAFKVLHHIQKEFMLHNASRIRTLSMSGVHTVEYAIALVPQLAAVTRLELTDVDDEDFQLEQVIDFIKSHRMLFGPALRHISIVEKGASTIGTSAPPSPTLLATSIAQEPIVGNQSISKSHSNILAVVDAIKSLECVDAVGWASCILYLDRIQTTNLKQLYLSFTFPPSESVESKAARLSEYLERCRNIEVIRIPIRRADVFQWAAQEKKTSLICAPILTGSRTKKLPKVRKLHLHGPSWELMDCVQDAAFAFQDTLEDLDARSQLRIWQPTTLRWDWYMLKLTKLRLEGEISLHFSFESLQRCPGLEELTLVMATGEYWRLQKPQQQHQQHWRSSSQPSQLSVTDQGSNLLLFLRSREMYRIGVLKRLKSLTLAGPWQVPDMALRRIADQCKRLRELTLDQTVGTTTGGILLAVENMQALESLDLRLDVEDLKLVHIAARKAPSLTRIKLTGVGLV